MHQKSYEKLDEKVIDQYHSLDLLIHRFAALA